MRKVSIFCFIFFIVPGILMAQLTGMSPSSGVHGQNLTTTITGNNIFIQSSSPSGNLYMIDLIQGANIINIYDYNTFWNWPTVIDPNTVTANFSIPISAVTGAYDLRVITGDVMFPNWNQNTYTLPAAFTVLPPAGYVTGTVYDDVNLNGVKDSGEPPIANQSVLLKPLNYTANSDINGNYSFPVQNGNYDIIIQGNYIDYQFPVSNDTIHITVNNANSPGNDFGMRRALISVTPDFGYKGITKTHEIISNEPIFTVGPSAYGNVGEVRIMSLPNVYVNVSSSVTVINSYKIRVTISIPAGTTAANNLDLRVFTYGTYYGYHYLKQQFDILTPPCFVSGTAFFDQNQNKIMEVGEPRINGLKTYLSPDSSIGFTDYYGNYLLTSLGGTQTLTQANNISGLQLFTDSSSYTFNATGNITGKNFGYISTAPNYSILVKDLYLFARCNSQQYVIFKVRNYSNVNYPVTVFLKRDPLMTFVNASVPPSLISNDTIYWTLANVAPYTEVSMYARFGLPGAGSHITFEVGAHSLNGGVIQMTDVKSASYNVFCSYDPNDKQVSPEGYFSQHYTLMSDTLNYTIRFQNTGTDTAFNIVILDTLDNKLNFSKFEITGSSHSVQTELEKNGVVSFNMKNILLPDSNVNEPASHGFIQYRIIVKSGLPNTTPVNNTARIYFDYNPAIITNTTLNTMVYTLPDPLPVQLIDFAAKVHEKNISVNWSTSSEVNNAFFTLQKGTDGITFKDIGSFEGAGTSSEFHAYTFLDNNPVNGIQYYRLIQVDFDGRSRTYDPVSVNWKNEIDFVVYPNPSNGALYIDLSSEFANQSAKMTITDNRGRLMISKEFVVGENMRHMSLLKSTEYLKAGSYFVRVEIGDESFIQLVIVN